MDKKISEGPPGIRCKQCERDVSQGLVFLGGPKAWIPFCSDCLYTSENRLAVAITATGLSDTDLAESMNLSQRTIQTWRRGRVKRPKRENVERLAALAGVPVSWLEGEDDAAPGQS